MRNKVCVCEWNRVARLDANDEGTIFIGNYFEARYPAEEELISPFFDCASEGSYCTYLPIVGNAEVNELFTGKPGVSYYYSGNQRIAMRTGGEAYLLFGDHLGSSSLLVRADGTEAEKAYYMPWGGERGATSITSTDYGYTGQMREGDIYYYGARWYDPAIGRFMQADTIVPLNVQGTQAFDRYAYVNNNPIRYTDPSGHGISPVNRMMLDGGGNPNPIAWIFLVGGVGDGVDNSGRFLPYRDIKGFAYQEFDVDYDYFSENIKNPGISPLYGYGKFNVAQDISNRITSTTGQVNLVCYSAGAGACGIAFSLVPDEFKSINNSITFLDPLSDATVPSGYPEKVFGMQRDANNVVETIDYISQSAMFYGFGFISVGQYRQNVNFNPEYHPNDHASYPNDALIADEAKKLFRNGAQ